MVKETKEHNLIPKIWRSRRRSVLIVTLLAVIGLIILLALPPRVNKRSNTLKLPDNLETLTTENAQQLESFGELNEGALLALRPNSSLLVVAPFQAPAHIFDYETAESIYTFTEYPIGLVFSHDGNTAATTTFGNDINLLDTKSYLKIAHFEGYTEGHTDIITALVFNPDGQWLASASFDKTIRIWDVTQKRGTAILRGHTDWVSDIAFSPDGKFLVSTSADGTVRIWDTTIWKTVKVMSIKNTKALDVAYNPQGNVIAVAYTDHLIRFWSTQTGEVVGILNGHTREVEEISFSPDGRLLASTSLDMALRLWDVDELKSLREITFQPILGLGSINFTPDGRLLLLNKNLSTIEFWGVSATN